MARSYFCPHCRKLLNPGTKVIFLVDTGQDYELMLLSAKLGDYSAVFARSMADADNGGMVRVSFSRVFGEKATFVTAPDGVARFGSDADQYEGINFFGEAWEPEGE